MAAQHEPLLPTAAVTAASRSSCYALLKIESVGSFVLCLCFSKGL